MSHETTQNVIDRLQYLFNRARSKLPSLNNRKGSSLHDIEVDFMYVLNDIKYESQYVRMLKIQEAKEIIRQLENLK